MTATTLSPSTVIAVAEPVFANAERLALAGFLAGYTGRVPANLHAAPACQADAAGTGATMS